MDRKGCDTQGMRREAECTDTHVTVLTVATVRNKETPTFIKY